MSLMLQWLEEDYCLIARTNWNVEQGFSIGKRIFNSPSGGSLGNIPNKTSNFSDYLSILWQPYIKVLSGLNNVEQIIGS